MHGLFFYIGLGLGLALACAMRPFLPLLLIGALGSAKALSIHFPAGSWHFLQSSWWLFAVAVVFVAAYFAQVLLGLCPVFDPVSRQPRRDPLAATLAGLSIGAGALLFGGVLWAHGDSPVAGVVAGILLVGLGQRVVGPIVVGARARLKDKGPRDALTLYLDAAALLLAVLCALLPPLGYIALAGALWLVWQRRSRSGQRYAGLRILGR